MNALTIFEPNSTEVNRSELRREQSSILARATGKQIVIVKANNRRDEKYILDKQYFDDLLRQLKSLVETLEITSDTKLFGNLMKAAETIDEDLRLGKLHSFEEAFE